MLPPLIKSSTLLVFLGKQVWTVDHSDGEYRVEYKCPWHYLNHFLINELGIGHRLPVDSEQQVLIDEVENGQGKQTGEVQDRDSTGVTHS